MDFLIDIKKEDGVFPVYLPFDPRAEFEIPKGEMYADCIIENVSLTAEIMLKGDGRYYIVLSDQLLKGIGISEEGRKNVHIKVDPAKMKEMPKHKASPPTINNETLKVIVERSSIRKFSDEKLTDIQINTMLHAGFCAPSAANKRPFHFVVSQDREKMVSIIGDNPYVKMLRNAAACVIVCGDEERQRVPELLLADCSAATQNILLAVHAIGLGGVWCGIMKDTDFYNGIVKAFSMPKNIRPVSLIPIGYCNEQVNRPDRFERNKIHFEVW